MPLAQPLDPSFSSGELSPRLWARLDFGKYQSGLEECQNLTLYTEGGAARRPGSRFVAEIKDSDVHGHLIAFQFNTEQAYVLELGNHSMRFFRHQGRIEVDDTDAVISNGDFTDGITGWDDISLTGGSIAYNSTLMSLTLTPGSAEATAEQDVTTTKQNQVHVIKFRVRSPVRGDQVKIQIGTTSGGNEIFGPAARKVGYHCIDFIPTASTFYVQFITDTDKDDKPVDVDDIEIIAGGAVEIGTPWPEAALHQVHGPQTADVLYLFHPDYPTHKLIRFGHRRWTLEEVLWSDGPYLAANTTATTLTPGATGGVAVTVTASSTTGINDGQGFLSTDIGRLIRIDNGAEWGWGIIAAITSTTVVTVHTKKSFAATTATANWHLGAWSATTGFPRTGMFFEQRTYVGYTEEQPQTFWASQTADFDNFKPDNDAGTVEADDAFEYTLSADNVNEIHWFSAGENTLVIGTEGGEWIPSSDTGVITATDNLTVRRQTTHGSTPTRPLRIGHTTIFVQRAGRKLREFGFSESIDGYESADLTRLAQHISKGGLNELAYAEEPDSIVWAVRSDGVLLSMAYRRQEDVIGWSRNILGGNFNGSIAEVECVVTIPGDDGAVNGQIQDSTDRNEVWIIVKRTINGMTKRYVEVLEGDFETGDAQEDAYYVDSCITYEGTPTAAITGLSHLEGETVKIWGDGAILAEKTVSGGSITLDEEISVAQIGLPYTHRMKPLRLTAGNPLGTPAGKHQRIHAITFFLLNSHRLRFAANAEQFHTVDFRVVSDVMDNAVPLFTGQQRLEFPGNWERDARIIIEGDAPAPFTLLAMAPEFIVNPAV